MDVEGRVRGGECGLGMESLEQTHKYRGRCTSIASVEQMQEYGDAGRCRSIESLHTRDGDAGRCREMQEYREQEYGESDAGVSRVWSELSPCQR